MSLSRPRPTPYQFPKIDPAKRRRLPAAPAPVELDEEASATAAPHPELDDDDAGPVELDAGPAQPVLPLDGDDGQRTSTF
jgi:hypothetical protein